MEKRSTPRLWPKSPNELYLSRGQDRHGTRRRLRALLRTEGRAVLHAMGAAIPRALELALEAVSESASLSESTSRGAGCTGAVQAGGEGGLQLSVNTSTLELVDDLRPLDPEVRFFCLCSSPNELTCVAALCRGGQGRQCGRCRRYTSPSSGARSDSASAVAHAANVTHRLAHEVIPKRWKPCVVQAWSCEPYLQRHSSMFWSLPFGTIYMGA